MGAGATPTQQENAGVTDHTPHGYHPASSYQHAPPPRQPGRRQHPLPGLDPGPFFLEAYRRPEPLPRIVKALTGDQTGEEIFSRNSVLHLPANAHPDQEQLLVFCKDWGWPTQGLRLGLYWRDEMPGESQLIIMGLVEGENPMFGPEAGPPPPQRGYPQPGQYGHYPPPGAPPQPGQHAPQGQYGYPPPGQHGHHPPPGAPPQQDPDDSPMNLMAMLMPMMAKLGHKEETIWTRLFKMEPTIADLEKLQEHWVHVRKIIEGGLDWLLPLIARKWVSAWDKEKTRYERAKGQRPRRKTTATKKPKRVRKTTGDP